MKPINKTSTVIKKLSDFSTLVDYSLVERLTPDSKATLDGCDYNPREVFSGHYVPVKPTAIKTPKYIAHSETLFKELGFCNTLATSKEFIKMFSGDTSDLPKPMRKLGWACGYALSIYGSEYYEQCPFQTGNGYGDGRAISILEVVINGQRLEMQLKGAGKTPYCRGADGRAVLRSSIREFLAQEHMYALNIPTSRSLSLYTSETETVERPWFFNGSYSKNPEVMIEEAVAITTRVASSFIRVGQLELFGRRARKEEHIEAMKELEQIVLYSIEREYSDVINQNLPLNEKILLLASEFCNRLTSLIANWIRVGYCQGNFNSDNCAVGGFTLDYGPFGFIDIFNPQYQPWTGGGVHFSFLNQPEAGRRNFNMFCLTLKQLLKSNQNALEQLDEIRSSFEKTMQNKLEKMWSAKLGLETFDAKLLDELMKLMIETNVDYTIFFRELSSIPKDITPLTKSFYNFSIYNEDISNRWSKWLKEWKSLIDCSNSSLEEISNQMKSINPKYTLREWFLVPAYQQATSGDYLAIKELQKVMTNPYDEHSKEIEKKYYRKKPSELFGKAGISHVSCSS